MNFKEIDNLVKTCEHQQYLISNLTTVSNYDIETLISLFAQDWYLSPPKDIKYAMNRLDKLNKEIKKENKKCLKK